MLELQQLLVVVDVHTIVMVEIENFLAVTRLFPELRLTDCRDVRRGCEKGSA
jgi:hypothetical protein